MADLRPFAIGQQAADIGGVTLTDLGVSAEAFVRKSELVRTGKFVTDNLAPYNDNMFVNLDAVKKQSTSELLLYWLETVSNPDDGAYQNMNAPADSTSLVICFHCSGNTSDPVVTLSGDSEGITYEVLDNSSISAEYNYKVALTLNGNSTDNKLTVRAAVTAKGEDENENTAYMTFYIDPLVSPTSLSFAAAGQEETINVFSHNTYTIE